MATSTLCNCGLNTDFIDSILVELRDSNNLCTSNPLCGTNPLCGIDFSEYTEFSDFAEFTDFTDFTDYEFTVPEFMTNPFGDEEIPVTGAHQSETKEGEEIPESITKEVNPTKCESGEEENASKSGDDEYASRNIDDENTSKGSNSPIEEIDDVPELSEPLEVLPRKLENVEQWKERLGRDEVFSHRYRPKAEEVEELEKISVDLGLQQGGLTWVTRSFAHLASPVAARKAASMNELMSQETESPRSVLLMRGPVTWNNDDQQNNETPSTPHEGELFLLTHGFILANVDDSSSRFFGNDQACKLWKMVDCVADMNCIKEENISSTNEYSFGIKYSSMDEKDRFLKLHAESEESKQVWMDALERIMVQHVMHNKDRLDQTERLGWQYERVLKPGYSAAVTGNIDQMGISSVSSSSQAETDTGRWNMLDSYNGYAPLHYAVQQEDCNVDVVESLMKAGADPNHPDVERRSAMFYVERDQLTHLRTVLASHGGKKSKLAEDLSKGKLFGGVAVASYRTEKRRQKEQAEAQRKADAAQAEMNKNMSLLNERGEKIRELGEKTTDLENEARNFADMASKLKHKVKKKKWYQR